MTITTLCGGDPERRPGAAMLFLANLERRHRQPEIMDLPDLEPHRHTAALRGLARINWWSGSARILWPSILILARRIPGTLRMLDVATGGGDVPIRLWQKARRAGLSLEVVGCDRSSFAVEYAKEQAQQAHAEVQFLELDALKDSLPGNYDIVTSSLFLHHLGEEQATSFLERLSTAAQKMVLINDLLRSRLGFALAYAGTRVLTRCEVVHVDGPRSVEGAFTVEEVSQLARRAGLAGATVSKRWPCRYLLKWERL